MWLSYNKKLKQFSRDLRNNSTLGEIMLWKRLRASQMCGYQFNRQKPIGNFIAGFYCKPLFLVTGALELSTNQFTHFYSKKKDTAEMLKLLDVLLLKYPKQRRLYLSWDAASWHMSKELNKKVKEINKQNGKSKIHLAPLPACAQFLNVIESVFSGMSRAIICNSNYGSAEQCKKAIDRYFNERNEHFKKHPKRAGKKIWGKERVIAEFKPSNNCKDPKYSHY